MNFYKKVIIFGIIGLVIIVVIVAYFLQTTMAKPIRVDLPESNTQALLLLLLIRDIEDDELRNFLRLIWYLDRWGYI